MIMYEFFSALMKAIIETFFAFLAENVIGWLFPS